MKPFPLLLLVTAAASAWGQSTPPPALDGQWKQQQLTNEFWAEGACAADVNRDGNPDILSGPFWYEGPRFGKRHPIAPATASFKLNDSSIAGFQGALSGKNAYSDNFTSYAADFNGDGWVDYCVIGFPGKPTVWWENPQGKEIPWTAHTILEVTDNESPMLADVTGDGKPELVCMSGGSIGYAQADWTKPNEVWTWHAVGKGPFQRFTHGIGCGDVNGDRRMDILESRGWWEQPANAGAEGPWIFHEAAWGKGGAQMYAMDVNGDGKMDVITSLAAHEYGLAWFEQTGEPAPKNWIQHLITGTPEAAGETGIIFSQIHAIDIADINGDGLPDIVTGKRFWAHGPTGDPEPQAPAVLWWFELRRNGASASWIPHLIDNNSGVGTQVMAVDLNGDKKPDVLVGNKQGVFVHTQR